MVDGTVLKVSLAVRVDVISEPVYCLDVNVHFEEETFERFLERNVDAVTGNKHIDVDLAALILNVDVAVVLKVLWRFGFDPGIVERIVLAALTVNTEQVESVLHTAFGHVG